MIGRYDEMGVLAVVCFSLAAAIIVLAMVTGSHAQTKETPVSCKDGSAWCDVRAPRPAEHWHYGNCDLIVRYCDIG